MTYFEGVRVAIDPHYPSLAISRGLWCKRIDLGPRALSLDVDARTAVLFHEVYHCHARHREKRLAALVLCLVLFPLWPLTKRALLALAHAQEYDADKFAKSKGYGVALARALRNSHDDEFHPPLNERLRRLVQ